MKRIPLITLFLLATLAHAPVLMAQRIAFVNTRYILDQMPEYESAQKELDRSSKQWQDEIDDRYQQIKRMRDAYNAEAILLTEEMKRSRLDEIDRREREARDLQKKRFGPEGDLFKKRVELIQPIQDRVYNAVKEVAGQSYVAVFDLGGQSSNLLFASEKYDKSDSVLRKLGIRPGKDKNSGNTREDEDFGEPPADNDRETTPPDGGKDSPQQRMDTGGRDQMKTK
ncbi:MAG TPA: OmpH family outer membrane protein [Flavobacteriales bacterium]|nr:OmpH family outer membrane protein [Flavobacteriales bacterium]HNU55332.1 OmpH family outer membrane protein [Flavobacteriales bacterium]